MTQQAATADQAGTWSRIVRRPAAVAGIVYTVAWLVSLVVGAPMPSAAASGGQVVAAYAGHDWPVIVNLVLSEGIAAIALAVVVLMTAQAARRAGARRAGRAGLAVAVFGVAVAAVSLAELVMSAWLQFGPVASGHAAAAGTLYSALQRIDGAKLFVLAAMAVALAVLSLVSTVLPRWLAALALLLAACLVISGLGFVLLNNALSDAVFVAAAPLLAVVTATGVTLADQPVAPLHQRKPLR